MLTLRASGSFTFWSKVNFTSNVSPETSLPSAGTTLTNDGASAAGLSGSPELFSTHAHTANDTAATINKLYIRIFIVLIGSRQQGQPLPE